ncbi:MAG: hypothetical protein PF487_01530 [Bacteroidales bacterium]|jgi:hypothetical protein|nr:hypothetical protein [Bacteroidales bacterium]
MFKTKYIYFYLIIITFFSDPFIWLLAFTDRYRIVNILLIFTSFIFILGKKIKISKTDKKWFSNLLLVFIFTVIHGLLFRDQTQIIQAIGYLFKVSFLFVCIYFIKKEIKLFIQLFLKFNIFVIYAGIILFVLLLIGIELPSIEFTQNISNNSIYIKDINWLYPLGVVNQKTYIGSFIFTSVCGLTDEPGQLGLLIIWLLILNEFTIKSLKIRNTLMITGFFTFSLGYFISLALFSIYLYIESFRRKSIIQFFAIAIFLLSIGYMVLPQNLQEVVKKETVYRLQKSNDKSKIFEGDNRSQAISTYFNNLNRDKRLIWGYGVTESIKKVNPRLFGVYGFAGLIFIYFPLLILLFRNKYDLKHKFLLLILIINLIQRPGIHYIVQIIILTLIFYWPVLIQVNSTKKSI